MKLHDIKKLNEAIVKNKGRTAIMKLLRSEVKKKMHLDPYSSYSESRKDHRVIKLHGVYNAIEVAEEMNRVIRDLHIPGVKAEARKAAPHMYGAPGVIVRFSKAEYPDVSAVAEDEEENVPFSSTFEVRVNFDNHANIENVKEVKETIEQLVRSLKSQDNGYNVAHVEVKHKKTTPR